MDFTITNSPGKPITALSFSPNPSQANRLLAASWDGTVRLYQLPWAKDVAKAEDASSHTRLVHTFAHESAVLDVCWISDTLAASVCVDRRVRLLNLLTGQTQVLGKHEAAASKVRYSPSTNLLITSSWDATVMVWDTKKQPPRLVRTISLPDKVLAMDVSPPYHQVSSSDSNTESIVKDAHPRLVVGMAGRAIHVFDLQKWRTLIDANENANDGSDDDTAWKAEQRRESSLKYMLRDLRCMPSGLGFALSSVEGRIAVEFFDASSTDPSMQKYAFKCHRQAEDGTDTVYPVNAIAFHPVHGTFTSIGGDATWAIWDPTAKKRIRQYPKMASPLSAAAISSDGQIQAVASGFENVVEQDDEIRREPLPPSDVQVATVIHVRTAAMDECRPRAKG